MSELPSSGDTAEPSIDLQNLGELDRLRERNRLLERMVRQQANADAGRLALVQAIEDNVPSRTPVPRPKLRPVRSNSGGGVGVLDISDVHWKEVVDAGSTGGVWQYNSAIATERYHHTIDEAIEIGRFHRVGEIVLIHGGDLISGKIHDDLERTNESMIIEQSLTFAEMAYTGIEKLLMAYRNIRNVNVSGNHPRLYDKPHFKHKQPENMDYLIAKLIEQYGKQQKGLEVITPESFWTIFAAAGRDFLTMHGDTNQHQASMGISFYKNEKELRKWVGMAHHGLIPHFDDMITHHQHTAATIPVGYATNFVNGSMKGGDEYSQAGTRPPSPAEQRMLIVEEGAVRANYLIQLDHIGKPERLDEAA